MLLVSFASYSSKCSNDAQSAVLTFFDMDARHAPIQDVSDNRVHAGFVCDWRWWTLFLLHNGDNICERKELWVHLSMSLLCPQLPLVNHSQIGHSRFKTTVWWPNHSQRKCWGLCRWIWQSIWTRSSNSLILLYPLAFLQGCSPRLLPAT